MMPWVFHMYIYSMTPSQPKPEQGQRPKWPRERRMNRSPLPPVLCLASGTNNSPLSCSVPTPPATKGACSESGERGICAGSEGSGSRYPCRCISLHFNVRLSHYSLIFDCQRCGDRHHSTIGSLPCCFIIAYIVQVCPKSHTARDLRVLLSDCSILIPTLRHSSRTNKSSHAKQSNTTRMST